MLTCSAGVGRTGTFITLDAQLRRIKKERTVDIFGFVRSMRKRRCYMVQTEVRVQSASLSKTHTHYISLQQQYIFLHDALLEAIECGVTEVAARDLQNQLQSLSEPDPVTDKTGLEKIFEVRLHQLFNKQRTLSITTHLFFSLTEAAEYSSLQRSKEYEFSACESAQEQIC